MVLTSPSSRARDTAALAGFPHAAVDHDLAEWDYGAFEGLTTPEIEATRPGWHLFRDGCPGGESVADISARADRVLARLGDGPALLFSSGHFLRVLGARWMGLPAAVGGALALDPASLSWLGDEHGGRDRVLRHWNMTATVER